MLDEVRRRRRSRMKRLEHSFTAREWAEALNYFNYRCSYCDTKTDALQREHVVPVSKGGPYTKGNIIPACSTCNTSKDSKDFEPWFREQVFYTKKREKKIKNYLKRG